MKYIAILLTVILLAGTIAPVLACVEPVKKIQKDEIFINTKVNQYAYVQSDFTIFILASEKDRMGGHQLSNKYPVSRADVHIEVKNLYKKYTIDVYDGKTSSRGFLAISEFVNSYEYFHGDKILIEITVSKGDATATSKHIVRIIDRGNGR